MYNIFGLVFFYSIIFWTINRFAITPKRSSPQTFHKKPTSRMGGVALMLAFLTQVFLLSNYNTSYPFFSIFLLCSIPVFITGLLDDLFLNIKPLQRLFLLMPTPILLFYFAGLRVTFVDIPILDFLLQNEIFALIFLIFAFVGIVNAFNIIDGFNALLLSFCLSIAVSIYLTTDDLNSAALNYLNIITTAVVSIGLLNIFGKIFLGDAGAYLLGSLIASGLILLQQNLEYSPWYVMLLFIYPVTEVFISFIRKVIYRNKSALEPDGLHFHMLVYKRISKKIGFKKIRLRHILVTTFIFLLNFPFMIFANVFAKNTAILIMLCVWYVLVYLLIYFILLPKYIFKK